jgi:hypothetical protein
MGEVRANIAIGENNFARRQSGFELGFCFKAVTCIEQGGEMRIDLFKGAEFAVEIACNELAKRRFIAREADFECRLPLLCQSARGVMG